MPQMSEPLPNVLMCLVQESLYCRFISHIWMACVLQRPPTWQAGIQRVNQCYVLWKIQPVLVCSDHITTEDRRVAIVLGQSCKCIHLSVLSDWKVCWSCFWKGWKNNAIGSSLAIYHLPVAMFIHSGKDPTDLWCRSCDWEYYLVEFVVDHHNLQNLPSFCRSQIGELSGDTKGSVTPASFRS